MPGWCVKDPDGNIVAEGEFTLIRVDVAEEIARRLEEQHGGDEQHAD